MSEVADYVVTPGIDQVAPNETAANLTRQLRDLQQAVKGLNKAWVGAFFANLFIKLPELVSFDVAFSREPEYNDEGGYYTVTSVQVSNVVSRVEEEPEGPDVDMDEEELSEDVTGMTADELEDELRDLIGEECESAAEALGLGTDQDGKFSIDGNLLAPVLSTGAPVSGHQAYSLLFAR